MKSALLNWGSVGYKTVVDEQLYLYTVESYQVVEEA